MAQVRLNPETGSPYCTGCYEEMHWLPWFLDSRCRGQEMARHLGSLGPRVQEFAKRHAGCDQRPEIVTVTDTGVTIIDRRRGSVAEG